jgi:hypothetical protein
MRIILSVFIIGVCLQSCSNFQTTKGNNDYGTVSKKQINEIIIDTLLNNWHQDVSNFNLKSYFEKLDSSFIFLGTDPNERWTKNQFYVFCKPYFEKKTTWNFKPLWRNVYFSEDGKTAWFEEQLDTWMDECRGSGVLIYRDNKWRLTHYNLTVLIENEKVQSFIDLRKE